MNIRRAVVVTVVTFAAAACAAHRPPATAEIPSEALALEVDNHNWADVTIYVLHDGTRTRFMQVAGAKSTTVELPPRLIGSNGTLQLLVHRIGGRDDSADLVSATGLNHTSDDYLSPVVSVRTGRTVSLTLEFDLQTSSIGVW